MLLPPALSALVRRHPSEGKASTISDIGIRLTEGLHDLRLDQQLAPTREALGQAFSASSSTLFRAFDGVRNEVSARLRERENSNGSPQPSNARIIATETRKDAKDNISGYSGPAASAPASNVPDIRATLGGIGSFLGARVASLQQAAASVRGPAIAAAAPSDNAGRRVSGLKTFSLRPGPAKVPGE